MSDPVNVMLVTAVGVVLAAYVALVAWIGRGLFAERLDPDGVPVDVTFCDECGDECAFDLDRHDPRWVRCDVCASREA